MFWAINKTFGTDLLITISILVISISFGIYLSIAFLVFIGDHREHLLFILAYLLYWIAPTIRCVYGCACMCRSIRLLFAGKRK